MRTKILIIAIICFTSSLNAQLLDGLETVLLAKEDAQKLIKGYTNPLAKSFIYGLNTGWAHTAKTHKPLGFDLTVGAGLSAAPDTDLSFMPENLSYVDSDNLVLPTVFSDANSVFLDVVIPSNSETEELRTTLEFPGGVGDVLPVSGVPTPTVQASVGLLFNTDIIVRYVPETSIEGANVSVSGIGFKHDLTQYLGAIEKLPFNLSILAAQTRVNSRYNIESITLSQNPAADIRYVDFNVKAQTLQLLGSLDFPFVSVFGAVGVSRGTADLGMKGVYELEYLQQVGGIDVSTSTSITNPISLDYSASSTLATIGARLNLAILKIYAQYSIQEYQTLSAGVSIGIR
jgi:hypothetical protein